MSNINPWIGFNSYTEYDSKIFRGRNEDAKNLIEIIDQSKLSLLYSESGIGKTSLINAAIIPVLREKYFFPVVIRFSDAYLASLDSNNIESIGDVIFETIENEVKIFSDNHYPVTLEYPSLKDTSTKYIKLFVVED